MSFPQHPFRHISLVDLDDNSIYFWRCDGCGADGQRQKDSIPIDVNSMSPNSVVSAIAQYHDHVKHSHRYTREQVKDWSV